MENKFQNINALLDYANKNPEGICTLVLHDRFFYAKSVKKAIDDIVLRASLGDVNESDRFLIDLLEKNMSSCG